MDESQKKYFEKLAYYEVRDTPHGPLGLFNFIYTVGICVGLNEHSYRYRYCFPTLLEALMALNDWAAAGYEDEPQGYIVRKGQGGDKRPSQNKLTGIPQPQ